MSVQCQQRTVVYYLSQNSGSANKRVTSDTPPQSFYCHGEERLCGRLGCKLEDKKKMYYSREGGHGLGSYGLQ